MGGHEKEYHVNQLLLAWQQWSAAHRRPLRLFRHTLIWLIVWGLATATVLYIVQDRPVVNAAIIALMALPALLCYYLFGYYVLPRFLYQFRPVWLIGSVLVAYWLIYLLNRTSFIALQPYTISPTSYLSRVTDLVERAGIWGCFTVIRVALWNCVLSLYVVLILLLVKAAKDTTNYRNQAISLQRDQLRLERDKLALERSHLTLELDFLKMQISPHFLFNTLNSIYSRVIDADEQAASQVLRLAELMRYNLYEASAERIALEHELSYINDYLQLEQSRQAQWVSVVLDTDEQVNQYQIAPLLLSTFVENAFKHGVRAGKPAYIQVNAQMDADALVFTVQNGLQSQTPSVSPSSAGRKSGGMGLVNVQKRLDLLYPGRYALEAGPVGDQYIVTLRLRVEVLAKQTV